MEKTTQSPTAQDIVCATILVGMIAALLFAPAILQHAGLFQ